MNLLNHKAISASAGSGKTFRLAHRYMGLLARGIPPDRICALTFSRKAAGEIFDSIVRNLTRAAQNAQYAERSSKYMETGPLPAGKFLSALRCFLENLHRANIGTIDSFIAAIVRAFPLELGLNDMEFRLMDGDSADAESFREGIIAAVCNSKDINKTGINIFLEVFKQATLGAEKKTFTDNLNGFLNNYRAAFLSMPAEDAWGNPARIWQQEPWWMPPPKAQNGKETERILQLILGDSGWDKRMRETFAKLINNLKDFDYDSEWTPSIFLDGAIQSQLIPKLGAPGQDGLAIQYARKEYLIPDNVFKLLRALYHNMFHVQFNRLCKRTRGILGVIAMYEKEYERALLQTGRMTFTDAQLLLSPRGFASGGATISRCPQACPGSGGDGRLFIDYRLDSKIDHWLLDEFQDTSNLQWQALENLLDEILQDDSNTRSFFYVGDVKQTIYRWRGGNPDLFNSVLNRYGKKIINESLNKTQRSARPIIDTVNRVFSRLPETQGEAPRGKPRGIFAEPPEARSRSEASERGAEASERAKDAILSCHPVLHSRFGDGGSSFGATEDPPCGKPQGFLAKEGETSEPAISRRVIAKWNSAWKEHECGEQAPDNGYAAILQPALPEGAKYHETEDQLELLARLLKHINPTERELSTAILVRTNASGKKIADYLRLYAHEHDWHDLNISYEGETALLDNPLIAVLLDLLRYAEHPADNFARQHLIMSPLGVWMDKNKTSVESLPLILLGQIEAQGFRAALREWAAKLGALDDFGRLRLQQMLEIAGQFDNRFDRNIPLFIKTVESYGMREASEARGCVHIMTIHQSKGLGFDLVILPDLNDNKKMNSAGAIDFLTGHSEGSNAPAWLLTVPDRKTAECDPTLRQSLEESDDLAALDNLCVLYVAMTRAKKALYMITRIQDKKFFNMAALLQQQLAIDESPKRIIPIDGLDADLLYATGDGHWYEKEKPVKSGIVAAIKPVKPAIPRQVRTALLNKIEPSLEETLSLKASWLFKAESPEVLYFGSAIHELFREVEWSDNCSPNEIIRNWKPKYPYPDIVLRDVKEQFMRVLTEPKIKEALSKPAGIVELWREKSFDVILDNNWISGVFDRVVIAHSADGTPISAQIIDYKSNRTSDPERIKDLVRIYRPQLALYRQALSRLLNLAEDKIETCLFFTVPRQIVRIN